MIDKEKLKLLELSVSEISKRQNLYQCIGTLGEKWPDSAFDSYSMPPVVNKDDLQACQQCTLSKTGG